MVLQTAALDQFSENKLTTHTPSYSTTPRTL